MHKHIFNRTIVFTDFAFSVINWTINGFNKMFNQFQVFICVNHHNFPLSPLTPITTDIHTWCAWCIVVAHCLRSEIVIWCSSYCMSLVLGIAARTQSHTLPRPREPHAIGHHVENKLFFWFNWASTKLNIATPIVFFRNQMLPREDHFYNKFMEEMGLKTQFELRTPRFGFGFGMCPWYHNSILFIFGGTRILQIIQRKS